MTTATGDARTRILDAALALMGEQGSQPTSMRQLAAATGLNVATLYHYFPSKADLLEALVAERGYLFELAVDRPPLAAEGTPTERVAALLGWIWEAAARENPVWKLLLGETARNEPVAVSSAARLSNGLCEALDRWLAALGVLDGEADADERRALSRLLQLTVLGGLVDELVGGASSWRRAQRATLAASALRLG